MFRRTLALVFVLTLISLANTRIDAQQSPGEWTGRPPVLQAPGEHEHDQGDQKAEIRRLQALVDAQNSKIRLLEAKVQLLEAEITKKGEESQK